MISFEKIKKGYSLLEVLIVLVIISFTMIGAINIIANASMAIKSNEIRDYANDLSLKALEIIKSSSDIFVDSDGFTALSILGNNTYFSLKEEGPTKYLKLDTPPTSVISSCDINSDYYNPVIINGQDKGYLICLQIHIVPRNLPSGTRYYEVDMQILYNLPSGQTVDTFKTYRYELFKEKP